MAWFREVMPEVETAAKLGCGWSEEPPVGSANGDDDDDDDVDKRDGMTGTAAAAGAAADPAGVTRV